MARCASWAPPVSAALAGRRATATAADAESRARAGTAALCSAVFRRSPAGARAPRSSRYPAECPRWGHQASRVTRMFMFWQRLETAPETRNRPLRVLSVNLRESGAGLTREHALTVKWCECQRGCELSERSDDFWRRHSERLPGEGSTWAKNQRFQARHFVRL